MPRKPSPTYRLTRDFVIPAGTVIGRPPSASSRWKSDYEGCAAIDRDHTAYLTLAVDEGLATGLIEEVPAK